MPTSARGISTEPVSTESRCRPARGALGRDVKSARGFTLIELTVIMVLLVIVLRLIVVRLGDHDGDAARTEAQRIALLIQTAQQEAILRGDVLAFAARDQGYQFLRLNDKEKLVPVDKDEVFYPRSMPPGVRISAFTVEGAADAGVLILPTGEFSPFNITLTQGAVSWRVEGLADGEIKALPQN